MKSASKSSRANRSQGALANRLEAWNTALVHYRGALSGLAWFLVVAAIIGMIAWSIPKLEDRFAQDAMLSERAIEIEYLHAPAWFDKDCRSALAACVTEQLRGTSPFDPQRLAKAVSTLKASGWFVEVRQVQLRASGSLEVDASFTTPFAMVRAGDTEYLVDVAGRRLGMTWIAGTRPATPHYPSIVGTQWAPPDEIGAQWKGGDVTAGLELAKFLAHKKWFHQVSAIDVSQFTDLRTLAIVAAGGGTIVWGLPPNDHDAAEVIPETKLSYIDHFYTRYGRIDSGAGKMMDLRGDLVTLAGGSRE